jgi:hypothetical protein
VPTFILLFLVTILLLLLLAEFPETGKAKRRRTAVVGGGVGVEEDDFDGKFLVSYMQIRLYLLLPVPIYFIYSIHRGSGGIGH